MTFLDTLRHADVFVEAMAAHDVEFRSVQRSRALFVLARWAIVPLYFHLGSVGYGAFQGQRLAGMLNLRGWRGSLHVDGLAVHPDFRRRGVGRALLQLAEREARKLNRRWLSLRVTVANEAAVKLYKSEGYCPAHHRTLVLETSALAANLNGQSGLRPLAGPGAQVAFLRHVRQDIATGDAWAAEILPRQMASRPASLGKRRWLWREDGRDVGYLSVRASRVFLAARPGTWGGDSERALLAGVAKRLPAKSERVELHLASLGHHEATAEALAALNPIEDTIPKMTMLKPLSEPEKDPHG